ncbi:MAG TPA: ABC transporter substrate-binding protein [Alphaproteobacteria bacterium]
MRCYLRTAVIVSALLLGTPVFAAEKVVFQLSWLPGGDRAVFYLAVQSGLFAAEGLDVQLLAGKGTTDAMTKLATGVADMAEGVFDALLTAKVQNDIPVKAVMPVFTKMPDGLETTSDSGITSLRDLAGKKVAMATFTSSSGPWPFLLRMNGVDPAQVNLTKVDANALAAMLATGQVDAIVHYVVNAPATALILAEAKKTLRVIPWSEYGLAGYSTSILVSDKVLATRRDAVVKVTRAMRKAELMMRADPDAAAAAAKQLVPQLDLPVTQMMVKATLPLMFNENTEKDGLGVFSPTLVKTTWEWVAKQQNVPMDKLDPIASVDFTIAKVQM